MLYRLWIGLFLIGLVFPLMAAKRLPDHADFDDASLGEPLAYPAWFKQSFLDLPEDLAEARAQGKRGIILYFGQHHCPYCKRLLQVNWGLPGMVSYTREYFDVIPFDIRGQAEVTGLSGELLSERDYAKQKKAMFTPTLVFLDREGKEALVLRGYYPPYQFRAALEYVADGHYHKEGFAAYLDRAADRLTFEPTDLNEESFFSPPPYNLNRTKLPGERPLAVFFEQGNCHACDVLHVQALQDPAIQQLFYSFDNVQLDIDSDTPVITPNGRKTTAHRWAQEMGLFYAPALVFFDESGRELLRADSVVHFFRLRNILNYITSRGYLTEPNFSHWR